MKRRIFFGLIVLLIAALFWSGCQKNEMELPGTEERSEKSLTVQEEVVKAGEDPVLEQEEPKYSIIQPEGMTLKTRILPPEGYERGKVDENSLTAFLRNYSMKEDKSPVLLYNGEQKGNQSAHIAVFQLPMESGNLQQCADSIMRIYAEYFWQIQEYDRIRFHFVSGFLADYSKWREGFRIVVNGNQVSWIKNAKPDDSYESFCKYLRMVFAYAGTLSMETESKALEFLDMEVGDLFLKAGSPGHVVMVIDVCEDKQGNKAFLLGQGYMPAQEFHVLKNPQNETNPWYYQAAMSYPLKTPEYTFAEGSLRRPEY